MIEVNAAACPATGGTVTQVNGYCVHTFTSSGTFTPNTVQSVEALVVAGGGAGGYTAVGSCGGGGGGGGVIYNSNFSTAKNNIASCRAILEAGASTGDGLYMIDPDGTGGNAAFQVYCDMTTDGGGWTRIAKFGTAYNITGSTYTTGFGTATASEYAHQCSLFNALGLTDATMRLNMGQVKDYFKPTSSYSICQMIAESPGTHFQWASTYNGTFQAPSYYSTHLGGSAVSWPTSIDGRNYLSFWGGGGSANSGCCHNTSTLYGGSADTAAWSKAFDMYIREPSNANLTVIVGAGGAQNTATPSGTGASGGDSYFGSMKAFGGGGGAGYKGLNGGYSYGANGGSGGGSENNATVSTSTQTSNNGGTGYGNSGGAGALNPAYNAGGGGGAGGAGYAGTSTVGGAGGAGKYFDISGVNTPYAGGGGGGIYSGGTSGGAGGIGGGGAGGDINGSSGIAGAANTGGGGGGRGRYNVGSGVGGAGGSGIVIVRYPAIAISVTTTIDGLYTVKKFTGVGSTTWTVPSGVTVVDYLVVAGGGGGGGTYGSGGGGAGGLLTNFGGAGLAVSGNVSVAVGAGGLASTVANYNNGYGFNGGNSSFGSVVATGGGGGAYINIGVTGGSGGGSSRVGASRSSGTSGQGNGGGAGYDSPSYASGGGGGAGGAGADGSSIKGGSAGAGGAGLQNSITGSPIYYAAGGGAGGDYFDGRSVAALGGSGIGGNGATGTVVAGNGVANTGSGGGGSGQTTSGTSVAGGNGGSGVVIIRYLTSAPLALAYYRPITINNTSNTSTLTNYQVLATVDTATLIAASKMKSDCGDIRFTDVSAIYNSGSWTNNFPYWIESGCNTSTTKIWVKVNSIAASSNKIIYMYYGDPSAVGISNGDSVFEFFDDFAGTSLDTNKWSNKLGTVTVAGGEAKLQANVWMYNNNLYPYDRAMRAKVKSAYFGNSSYNLQCNFNNIDTDIPAYSGSFAIFSHPSALINGKYSNYNGTHYASDIAGWTAGTYHTLDIARAGTTVVKNYVDNANEVINTTGITTEDHRLYLYSSINDGVIVDWILVRNYSSIEPVITVGAELSSEYNSTPSISPNMSCRLTSGTCTGTNEVIVFKIYDPAGNHAELSGSYPYRVCCTGANLSNSCSGTYKDTVLRLSGVTNAHAQKKSLSTYTNEVCLSSSTTPITCGYSDTACSSLGTTYVCLASISSDDNAHVGECATYTTKVCCDASIAVDPCIAKVASNKFISAKDTNIQLCSGADTTNPADPCYSVCWKGIGTPVVNSPNWACGVCHDSSNAPVACTAANSTFNWVMPAGYTTPANYTLIDSTTLTSPNPIVRFTAQDSTRKLTLTTSNYGVTCSSSTAVQLIPKWKEITPFK